MGTFGSESGSELGWVDIVEPTLEVEEKGGNFKIQLLKEADFVGEGGGGGNKVRVNVKRHWGALVGRVEAFPGRERG